MNKAFDGDERRVIPAWEVGGEKIVLSGVPCCDVDGGAVVLGFPGIYLCLNLITWIFYVGVTSRPFKLRRDGHLASGKSGVNVKFRAALT